MLSFFANKGWDHRDWKVRQKTALQSKDEARLRSHALTDVSEEVRVAAVGQINDSEALLEIAKVSACPRTRQLAVKRIRSPEALNVLIFNHSLPEDVRICALGGVPADENLLGAYLPEAPPDFRSALLEKVKGVEQDVFWSNVAQQEPLLDLRVAAIERIRSEKALAKLTRTESDPELRRLISDRVHAPELLYQLLQIETRESQRIWLASRIDAPEYLDRIVRGDENPHVRKAALLRIRHPATLVGLACDNLPLFIANAALARLHDDESRGRIAMTSPHESVRAEALRTICDEGVLARLEEEAEHPDIRWLAGRRNDSMPIRALNEIQHGPTLRRLIELEPEADVATWLVGRVEDQETLRVIGGSTFPGDIAARRRLSECKGPYDLRFMPVPGRPYAMGVFPVTNRQLREALGPSASTGDDDLPATGMPPEVAARFCEALNAHGRRAYRLPSFDEWLHATLTDDENWLLAATGQLSSGDSLLGKQRVAFNARGRRCARLARPNPWGLLDMVGNVVVWVDNSALPWLALAKNDPLALDGDLNYPSDFAAAAGVSWADTRVRKEQLQRVVAHATLAGWAADKVGFRVVCELENALPPTTRYEVFLDRATAPGFTHERVFAALRQRSREIATKLETWYRVAPAMILQTASYPEARQLRSVLESCGATTRLAVKTRA